RPAEFDFLDDRIHHLACPNNYRAPESVGEAEFLDGLVEEFEPKILDLGADRVGAFISEPVYGSAGVIVP
ncbi:aspartate aminotransferase family protein, partial [Pseudomonas aeruginosa]